MIEMITLFFVILCVGGVDGEVGPAAVHHLGHIKFNGVIMSGIFIDLFSVN